MLCWFIKKQMPVKFEARLWEVFKLNWKNEEEKDGLNERMGKKKRKESEGENVWAIWTDTRCVQLVWNQTEWVGWIF